ncbi:hypothetical protein C1933_08530 [Stenotrophomonas sp. ZAC14D2_NAIMI4_6]|nr:hypothetical protein C1933_08530 [Stenotrophomonas sp. ZAC14D2_NAIMI4_6]
MTRAESAASARISRCRFTRWIDAFTLRPRQLVGPQVTSRGQGARGQVFTRHASVACTLAVATAVSRLAEARASTAAGAILVSLLFHRQLMLPLGAMSQGQHA